MHTCFFFPRSIVALRCDRCCLTWIQGGAPYFAKSVPRCLLYAAIFIAFHLFKSSGEGGSCSTTSMLSRPLRIAVAIAPQNAGGYSFRNPVLQWPSWLNPIALPFGSSERVIHFLSSIARSGRLTTKRSVGLGDGAPKSPWASRLRVTPGAARSAWTKGSFQIAAACSSVGSAGCSTMPMPPAWIITEANSKVKVSSSFPVAIWTNSFNARLGSPHKCSYEYIYIYIYIYSFI